MGNALDCHDMHDRRYFAGLIVLVVLEAAFFTFYGISRHYNYLTSINDLGCFDQAIWGILNGAPFLNTIIFNEPTNWLGFHFHPVLALFAPFYLIVPSVIWLILAQAMALPLAALPIYFLARHVTRSETAALFWAVAYLFMPFMLSAASWDFHPVSLAVPFVALACLALEQGRFLLLLGCCLFILLCKEHFGLMVFGFGLLWLVRRRELLPSLVLVFVGVCHFGVVLKLIMPAFSPAGEHVMLAEGFNQLSRYSWLGDSLSEIFITILTCPLETGHHVLVAMEGRLYLALLLFPFLGLPLIGIELILPAAGDLMANILSANPMPRSVFAYHSVTMLPILFAAAIVGSCRLLHFIKVTKPELPAFMVMSVTLILGWALFPFFSLPGSYKLWEPRRVLEFYDENYAEIASLITPGMSVSVQANLGTHFTQRAKVYNFPNKVGNVDTVILRLDSPTTRLRVDASQRVASLGHHLQMEPMAYLLSVREILESDIYPKVVWKEPWLILMKGNEKFNSIDEIEGKIRIIELDWKLNDDNK